MDSVAHIIIVSAAYMYIMFSFLAPVDEELGVTLGSILGTVAVISIISITVLLLCFIVPSCPMKKLYSQRYTELSNDSEHNSVPEDHQTTIDSPPPPYVSLFANTNLTNTTLIPPNNSNAGVDTLALEQPDTAAEAMPTIPDHSVDDDDEDTSLLDVTETTLLIQDTDTALQVTSPPPVTPVPLESADILPEIGGHEPNLPNSVETNDK